MDKGGILVMAALAVVLAACDDAGSSTAAGTEGGACLPSDDCDPGLTCVSGLCVRLPDASIPACGDSAPPSIDGTGVISLELQRYTQKTGSDCGPTSLWMVTSFWGGTLSYDDVMKHFTILPGIGVYDSHIAMAAMDLGYKATIISYNYRVLHPLWHGLSGDQLVAKLESYLPKITNQKDEVSVTGYIDYLKRKGEITFQPLSRELIVSYLIKGIPVIVSLDVEYLYKGMTTTDPFLPEHWTHAVVVHGYNPASDEFVVSDPWPQIPLSHTDGRYTLSSARLITAILLAFQINDGFMVVVEKT
jgi:hypothetical protein